ncbi:MAG: N-methyl-D-aspartate receptor NMDAR2C subunit [Comamonadaceae bacterium]|nr:MAG: N-methyl-D-aspartate receptor NMDAR2C subunit [Comamonadaceae bacterium]
MDTAALARSWQSAWSAVGVEVPDPALFAELLARYTEPQRHYHTLQHLGECLDALADAHDLAERPGEVALALWFHDAIYDLDAHDNEARSADWAARALTAEGASNEAAARVHALVMATCHTAQPTEADAQLLVDIDLSILGAPAARFAEYEAQIRREYAHIPTDVFEPRRRRILGTFLARDPLYQTPGIRARCEANARVNLRRAIGD